MAGCSGSKNFYDILNVRSDSSDKEIRSAYVELSKKFHPDVKSATPDAQKTAAFLKIAEAYQTLSKPKLRKEYDFNLKAAQSMRVYQTSSSTKSEFHRPWEIKPDYDPNPGPYYGVKGINRTTNSRVALALIVMGIFSGIIGYVSVKQSIHLNNQRLDNISTRANEHHKKIRTDVEKYSTDEQLKRVIDRIETQAQR